MHRSDLVMNLVLVWLMVVFSNGHCIGQNMYGMLPQPLFPVSECDSIVRISNDNYQIYIEQLVKYPEQTEEYIETGVKESGEKVNPEDLFSYVEQYIAEMKKKSGEVKMPKVIPIPTRQLTL